MSDARETEPLDPELDTGRGGRISLIWAFPVIAILITLGLLWRDYAGRGPVIEISFPTAAGLVAGETGLKFRNVEVGRVEDLNFSDDLSRVVAVVRVDPEIASYIDEDAEFWVVRPEVSAQGISGLDTVISGAYIEGIWDAEEGVARRKFTARDEAPLTPSDTPGIQVKLKAADGGALTVGAPVFYRRVEVGKVETKRLTDDGQAVVFDIFVNAPNDLRLTSETRFWVVPGVDMSFGAEGARFSIGSLSALLKGGVSFEDFSGGSAPKVETGHLFEIYASPGDARTQVQEVDPGEQLLLDVYFGGSVRGLSPGASVEYQGIRVGRVIGITAETDAANSRFETRTRIAIAPALLGLDDDEVAGALAFIEGAVANGLRAQLTQGNFLTGTLIVQLVDAPETTPATVERRGDAWLVMPAIASELDEFAGSVQGALRKVDDLPFEALFQNAVSLLENVNAIVGSDAAKAAPGRALAALDAAAALLASPGVARIPAETAQLLASLNEIATSDEIKTARADFAATLASFRALASSLEGSGLSEDAAAAAAALRARLEDPALAGLIAELETASAAAGALLADPALQAASGKAAAALDAATALLTSPGLVAAPAEAQSLLAAMRDFIAAPELAAARADLAAVLSDARALSGDLKAGDAGGQATAALAAFRARLEDPALAGLAAAVADAAAAAAALISNPALQSTPEAFNAALSSLRVVLDDPALKAAPQEMTASLAAARSMLEELERAGAATELSGAIASARALLDDPSVRRLSAEAADTAAALRAVLAAPGANEMPAAAAAALKSTAAFLDRLREEDLAGTAAAALQSLDTATSAVTRAADGTPQLISRLSALASRMDAILASFDVGSEFNYETIAAIREIRDAARSITDLADLVERQPNAFIIGK